MFEELFLTKLHLVSSFMYLFFYLRAFHTGLFILCLKDDPWFSGNSEAGTPAFESDAIATDPPSVQTGGTELYLSNR